MRWSFLIFKFKGIGVKVHLTFLLVLIWAAYSWSIELGKGWRGALFGIVAITLLFLSVVLHEFGHSLTAIKYGAKVKEITLLPIGGVSQIESLPEDPKQEFKIAIIGPLINFAIVTILWFVVGFLFKFRVITHFAELKLIVGQISWRGMLFYLIFANLILGLFNLIPAFPMDGGRVLRSLLAMKMNYLKATRRAVLIGEIIAIILGLWGFMFSNFFLVLIAFFVFFGATQEGRQVELKTALKRIIVEEAYSKNIQILAPDDPIAKAITLSLHSFQSDFPVIQEGRVVGILTKTEILSGVHKHHPQIPVAQVMRRDFQIASPGDSLFDIQQKMADKRLSAVPVVEKGTLLGLLTLEDINEAYRLLA
ncbi:MAG: site-2 protease family protein [candidate division WOR-3 bacterium]